MRMEFIFLSTVISGPNTPSRNIDVCLWPLINELMQLWSFEALIYDVSRKQNFLIRATLIWTINNIPAYGMVSGWSTHEKLACSYYMKNNKASTLTNGGKTSWVISISNLYYPIKASNKFFHLIILELANHIYQVRVASLKLSWKKWINNFSLWITSTILL